MEFGGCRGRGVEFNPIGEQSSFAKAAPPPGKQSRPVTVPQQGAPNGHQFVYVTSA